MGSRKHGPPTPDCGVAGRAFQLRFQVEKQNYGGMQLQPYSRCRYGRMVLSLQQRQPS